MTKTFEVTYLTDSLDQESLKIMDVPGYSHIKFGGDREIYGAGMTYQTETAFISAANEATLRRNLRSVFGHAWTELYHEITLVGADRRRY